MDDRKERTIVFEFRECKVRLTMESRVKETFGNQLDHYFGFSDPYDGDTYDPLESESAREDLKFEITELIASGGGGEISLLDVDVVVNTDWKIAVMFKNKEYLSTDEGLNAIIDFGQVECISASVTIPPVDTYIGAGGFDRWCEDLVWCSEDAYVDSVFMFGEAAVFGYEAEWI